MCRVFDLRWREDCAGANGWMLGSVDVTLLHTDPQHAFIDFGHGVGQKADHGLKDRTDRALADRDRTDSAPACVDSIFRRMGHLGSP